MESQTFRVITAPAGRLFRILQVTDSHGDVDENLNEKTRADIKIMVNRFNPDLIAVTGDIWCGDDHPDAAPMWMRRELAFFGSLNIPWAFVWGNHDFTGCFSDTMAQIAATPNALAPKGDGRGNFRSEIRTAEDNRISWDIFFLNSGPSWHLPEDLDWFEEESVRIAAARGHVVPAIVYFHIPLKNYQTAIDNGRTIGPGDEEVLHWGDDEGLAAPIVKRPGNVRACFCGHSHKNDFYFEEDGIVFTYGRATGYGGYGGEILRKGGKLLELDLVDETFRFQTVFADGASELEYPSR